MAPELEPMSRARSPFDPSEALRRVLLALLVVGSLSMAADLLLLAHYESVWMLAPFAALALALACAVARLTRPSAQTVRVLRGGMIALFVTGLAGLGMHYQAGLEFQVDMDPTLSRWALVWKVARMKAPPPLAPGALLQLSLLGLAITYRDPLITRHVTPTSGAPSRGNTP
jgi:hypothetical protein